MRSITNIACRYAIAAAAISVRTYAAVSIERSAESGRRGIRSRARREFFLETHSICYRPWRETSVSFFGCDVLCVNSRSLQRSGSE